MVGISANEPLVVRHFFDGAVELSLPERFIDISDFRPVPDHQEVFADGNSDQSLVFEIVEHVADKSNEESPQFFWNNLAETQSALSSSVEYASPLQPEEVPGLAADVFKSVVVGYQEVSKGRQGPEAANQVQICMGVVRLPSVGTDLLVSLNSPVVINEKSASAREVGSGFQANNTTAPALMKRIMRTLKIVDWGLFG